MGNMLHTKKQDMKDTDAKKTTALSTKESLAGKLSAKVTGFFHKEKFSLKDYIIAIACFVVIYIIIYEIVFNIFFFWSIVPTPSMLPTIDVDAKLLVSKSTRHLKCGDIVVFNNKEYGEYMVKRLIGLPGDTITLKDYYVYVNGEPLQEDYLDEQCYYETQTFTVPQDSYFFLGDNRDNSIDSREWETPYIEKEDLMGKVVKIYNEP